MSFLAETLDRPMTFEDLGHFPDDGKRREIIGGKLYVAAAPSKKHQEGSRRPFRLFDVAVAATGRGKVHYAPVDVRFPTGEQVQPDLLVLLNEHVDRSRGNTVLGPPDIAVKIQSPSYRFVDLVEKAALYAAQGDLEYWQADPDKPDLAILALRDGRYVPVEPDTDGRLRSTVIPDLIVDPVALLADLG